MSDNDMDPSDMDHSGIGDDDYEENEGFDDIEEVAREEEEDEDDSDTLDLDPEMIAGAAVAGLQDEVDRLNEKLLRAAAELENTRRRAERERADAGKYAIANFARDLLSVADNFERALASTPAEPTEMSADALKGLLTGVSMTEKELLKTLERHGVKRLSPKGEKFDPNVHQAVAQAPAPGVPSGHVADVAQTGFVLNDRVLRAAMVVVSTGEPENAQNPAPTGAPQAEAPQGQNAPAADSNANAPSPEQGSGDDPAAPTGTRINTRV